jgi:hypothetical protein
VVNFYPQYVISAGTSKSVKVRVNSSGFADAAGASDTFTATIENMNDVTVTDGTAAFGIDWQSLPLLVANTSY